MSVIADIKKDISNIEDQIYELLNEFQIKYEGLQIDSIDLDTIHELHISHMIISGVHMRITFV